jgi:hypothetical protein
MRKSLLAVVLPVAAFVALAGTGFGVWVFNTTTESKVGADFVVTNAVSLDGLQASTSGILTLDQADDTFTTQSNVVLNVKANYEAIQGVKGDAADKSTSYTYTDNAASGATLKLNIAGVIAGGLEKYVAIDSIANVTAGVSAPITLGTTETVSEDYAVTFKWSAKPTTLQGYKDMLKDAKTSTVIFTVSVNSLVAA